MLQPLNGIYVQDQIELLRKNGLQVDLVYADLNIAYLMKGHFQKRRTIKIDHRGNKEYVLSGPTWPKNNLFGFKNWVKKYVLLIEDYIKKEGPPDIIWAHTYLGAIISSKIQSFDIPFIVTVHFTGWINHTIPKLHKREGLKAFKRATAVCAVSKFLKDHLENTFHISCHLVPNFIDEDKFNLSSLDINLTRFELLAVGDLIERKNWKGILTIINRVKGKIPNCRLTVVGSGNKMSEISTLIQKLDLDQNVRLIGHVDKHDMPSVYNDAHILVHTSNLETFGIVILEALFSGLPVIAYESGPIGEILHHSALGSVIAIGDEQSFERAIIDHYNNLKILNREQIRELALKKYASKSIIDELMSLMRRKINLQKATSTY